MSKRKAGRQGRLAMRRADRDAGFAQTDDPAHGPIEAAVRSKMRTIARLVDQAINPGGRRYGFMLTTFKLDGGGRYNYISNCKDRAGMVKDLRALADQLERTARWDGEQQSVTEQ